MKSLKKLKYGLSRHDTDRNTFRDIFELEVEGKPELESGVYHAQRT